MTETSTLTLTGFLLARIAEDEKERNVDLAPWPFDYSPSDIAEAKRWKAECEAKQRIVEMVPDLSGVLMALALPYADHPDYRDEWKP